MQTYTKAYLLRDLRFYDGWSETKADERTDRVGSREPGSPPHRLEDRDIVYLRADGVVTRDAFGEGGIVFDDVTPEWLTFCRERLDFRVPDWQTGWAPREFLDGPDTGGVEE